jgi:deoxycytidylate deaminase
MNPIIDILITAGVMRKLLVNLIFYSTEHPCMTITIHIFSKLLI